jgi:hypothetical protein
MLLLTASAGLAVNQDRNADAVFANVFDPNRVCVGDGSGGFSCADVSPDSHFRTHVSHDVALGDLNLDGLVDAVFANALRNQVCLGDGQAGFSCQDVSLDENDSRGVALGDFNGDRIPDAIFANGEVSGEFGELNRVCLGDGSGSFECRDVSPDPDRASGVALGDVNADGFLDAVIAAHSSTRNRVCLGDGTGGFACSSAFSPNPWPSVDVALGDLNGDQLLDAVFANDGVPGAPNTACLGDGSGNFACSNVEAVANDTAGVALGEINNDGLLDAVFANPGQPNRVCLGHYLSSGFSCHDMSPDANESRDIALADVNGDGRLDAVIANRGQPNRLCLGHGYSGGFACQDLSVDVSLSDGVALSPLDPRLYLVDTEEDLPDASPGDGICATSDGRCSLRAAVEEANTIGASSEIELPAGRYTLSSPLTVCALPAPYQAVCPTRVSILGQGREASVIDAAGSENALFVFAEGGVELELRSLGIVGASLFGVDWRDEGFSGTLTVSDVAIHGNGGGICICQPGWSPFPAVPLALPGQYRGDLIENSTVSWNAGAGIIVNNGLAAGIAIRSSTILGNGGRGVICIDSCGLSLESSRIEGNSGGGMYFYEASAEIVGSTIAGNVASMGGGIRLDNSTARVKNSTISGNTATKEGGGILGDIGIVWLENATITGNTAPVGGGFAARDYGELHLVASILAANEAVAGPDCGIADDYGSAYLVSNGFNVIGASGCGFSPAPTDQVGSEDEPLDPVLGPLRDNGGATPTHALLAGSPAIDTVPFPDCLFLEDQRGVARPQGPACDSGAYEFAVECDDGIDNDADGLVDYPDDLDCRTASALSETSVAPGPSCGIGPELVLITPLLLLGYQRRQRRRVAVS